MKRLASVVVVLVLVLTMFAFAPVSAEALSASQVKEGVDSFLEKYPAGEINPWNECYDFINEISKEVFGHGLPSQHSSKVKFNDDYKDNFIQIGETLTVSENTLTEDSLKTLFSSARCGDVVQMHYTTYEGIKSYHVMMVYSVSSEGVVFYHAGRYKDRNGDGIKERGKVYFGVGAYRDKLNGNTGEPITWADFKDLFVNSENGISVYRSKKSEGPVGYQFNTVNDTVASTYSTDVDMTISIFGRDECLNSNTVLQNVIKSGITTQKNIRVLFIDCDQKTKKQVQKMADRYKESNILFCYDTTEVAIGAMRKFSNEAGLGNSFTIPLIVFTKRDGTIFKVTEGVLEADYLYQLANGDLSGEELINLKVAGTVNYDYAFEVLERLNDLRKSLNLDPLKMDEDAMAFAMQRAAELSLYYSHTRPNGETCGYSAENIAIGQKTPKDVINSWKNSEGHYKNMTNSKYSSIGIGCFKTSDGYWCWVQLFSTNNAKLVNKAGALTNEYTISMQIRNLSLVFSPENDIHTLESGGYTKINVWNRNKCFSYSKQLVSGTLFNFESSNSDVIAITNNGYCTIRGAGTSTVTVSHKESDAFKLIADYRVGHIYTNNCDTSCDYCGATRSIKHLYSNTCDTACNKCGETRTITHSYGAYVFNDDATSEKDGTKTRICSVCSKEETVTATGTKLKNSAALFADVKAGEWYKPYIDYAVSYKLLNGAGNSMEPERTMNRAEFVQVLANLSGIDTSNNQINTEFTDVNAGDWYAPAVKWASSNGIVYGVDVGVFAPEEQINREQMCTMLIRYIEKYLKVTLEKKDSKKNFADDWKISDWAKEFVYKCQEGGLIKGVSPTEFDPLSNATRAEVATIMTRFHQQYINS